MQRRQEVSEDEKHQAREVFERATRAADEHGQEVSEDEKHQARVVFDRALAAADEHAPPEDPAEREAWEQKRAHEERLEAAEVLAALRAEHARVGTEIEDPRHDGADLTDYQQGYIDGLDFARGLLSEPVIAPKAPAEYKPPTA
jgi:hypothetical protein